MRLAIVILTFIFSLIEPALANGEVQPHRAYYTITMESLPSPQNPLQDIRGTMMIELSPADNGWTTQHILEAWRYYEDDSMEHTKSGHVTWESDDGCCFRFNSYNKSNGELVEEIRGTACKQSSRIVVNYTKPEQKAITLPEGTLFPLEQLRTLLKTAAQGNHVLSQTIFDGTNAEGAIEMNTFIGAKKLNKEGSTANSPSQFANQPFWPIRFSIFELGGIGYESASTICQELLPSGIIKKYVIDSDGIKIKGTLERVELLPRS